MATDTSTSTGAHDDAELDTALEELQPAPPEVAGFPVRPRRRITWKLLLGAILLLAWAKCVAKGPAWLVDRGEKAMGDCLDAAANTHGDPSSCRTGVGFALGRLFPEVRVHARDVEDGFLQRRARLAFDHVMASNPTAARRDAAATRFIHDAPDRVAAISQAASEGAFGAVAAADLGSASLGTRLEPAFAALTLGDVATARANLAHGDPVGIDGGEQSAALACLLGDRTRGLALLRSARAFERRNGTPDDAVRFAAQHCGGSYDTLGFDPVVVSSPSVMVAVITRLFDPAVQAGHRAAIGVALLRETSIERGAVIAAFALAADGAQEASPTELLEAFGSVFVHELDLGVPFAKTPWLVWQANSLTDAAGDYVPPPWLELAATRYAHAAQHAPTRLDPQTVDISERVPQVPRDALLAAACLAYEFAAGYRLRGGDRTGARAVLEQWRALAPTDVRRAPLEVAIGDPVAALSTLDTWQAAQPGAVDPDLREFADVNRVFALAATGGYAKAYAIAKGTHGPSGAWLMLATAIASGAPLAGLPSLEGKAGPLSTDLSAQEVLAAIEAKQPIRTEYRYVSEGAREVLPAVMVALARAAQVAGQDPDVVLDAMFADKMPSRAVAIARAEAARWRNDIAAAELWDARARTIEQLFSDDHAVVLGGIAGLW